MKSNQVLNMTLAFVVLTIASADLYGDSYGSSHSCYEPSKPYDLSDSYALDSFLDDVQDYRDCIADYIEEQQDQAQYHLEAAEEAARDWEWFFQRELQ